MGNTVTVNKMLISPTHDQWKTYADHGDIEIIKGGKRGRVEVKGLRVNFTGKTDWPFRDFIVCAKHSFDKAHPKPVYYIVASNDRTAVAIVDTTTSHRWSVVKRQDSRYQDITQDFYVCPLELIEWRLI